LNNYNETITLNQIIITNKSGVRQIKPQKQTQIRCALQYSWTTWSTIGYTVGEELML